MITDKDKEKVKEIQEYLNKLIFQDEVNVDWKKVSWTEVLDRMTYNLEIAPLSYREASKEDKGNRFYTAICEKCEWWGSSRLLLGGGALADTGDYDDCLCPVCGSTDIEEYNLNYEMLHNKPKKK